MRLNENYIRNVVRRVINEVAQTQGNDIVASYNEFLSTQAGWWKYDGKNLIFSDDNGFEIVVPLSIEDLKNGNDEPINEFDESTLTAKYWLDGNIPSKVSRYSNINIESLYNYIIDAFSDLWTYGMPSKFIGYLEDGQL